MVVIDRCPPFQVVQEPVLACAELNVACEWLFGSTHGCEPGDPCHLGFV